MGDFRWKRLYACCRVTWWTGSLIKLQRWHELPIFLSLKECPDNFGNWICYRCKYKGKIWSTYWYSSSLFIQVSCLVLQMFPRDITLEEGSFGLFCPLKKALLLPVSWTPPPDFLLLARYLRKTISLAILNWSDIWRDFRHWNFRK